MQKLCLQYILKVKMKFDWDTSVPEGMKGLKDYLLNKHGDINICYIW